MAFSCMVEHGKDTPLGNTTLDTRRLLDSFLLLF